MDGTETHTRYQRSNSEQLEVNVKLFSVIRKRFMSIQAKVKKIKKLLGKKPQPNINAQDDNDNWNTALHLAIERNELEVVNFLLSQGADTTIENGDGKTSLDLAELYKNIEIIDVLQSCTSQVECPLSDTDRLASHVSQPVAANPNQVPVFHSNSHTAVTGTQTASTVLPPFSGKLRVDKELKLSHDDFKQLIKQFYANKQLSAIYQLKATPPYPTPHLLAQFASRAYRDYKHTDPEPPDGWQLLTTASNCGINNGYFGTAYWHPEHQQVVIAHRGTDIKTVGALVTDVKGVLFNNHVQQISSASTFANKVVAVLQEIEQEKKVSFELVFTGHSLGGWLAQITAFTIEYLVEKGGIFLKKLKRGEYEPPASNTVQDSHDVTHSYHPHTVVFDSPGCKDMLSQLADKLDVRLHGNSVDLHHLDITSYLSAPNLINTCHSHLGTVYRMFIDLSDMGWKEQHTPLYNLATHSMDKIVQAFDFVTGQVLKDSKGELKILEVVDWPVSAGLTYGAELTSFFKWAKHLNNYHPQAMDISHSKIPKGYHALRYQTKAYDECTKSLGVFTQDEREFLERYRWLRHVPEFIKPQDLFYVMSNAEAEIEAEQKLQNFELDNESVRCPDASTLHTLIPYVKRLVKLFPHIKQKVKEKLLSPHIINKVYQHETQRCVIKITQNKLHFKPGALRLREFLDSDHQIWHLRMLDGDAWTGITKVYRDLQNTSCMANCIREVHYNVLELERLLAINQMINLNAILESTQSPHLLMIAYGNNQPVNDEIENIFRVLFNILKQKSNIKFILTTQSETDSTSFIQQIATETLGKGFITTDEQLTWSDLTTSSKRKMLEKRAIFQGRPVALNQITSAESIRDSFPLADLLQEKELTIGQEPVPSANSGYNEKYYIDRTLNQNIVIRQDITSDKREGKLVDLLASTEQEFTQLCQHNPNSNVHWLVKRMSGELVWQQSQGNLKSLRTYVDAQKTLFYASSDLDELLQKAKHQSVMLIADTAGMGKTTVLIHLSKRIKQKYPAHWLVRIDLNDYTELLKAQKGKKMDKMRVLEFVSKEVLKLESHLERELFKRSFEGNGVNKVVVMVDGFDEISPQYKETVIDMLQVLKQTSLEQLWVTTRPHLREDLEDKLQQLSYTLQPFSEVEQILFLKKFWPENLHIQVTNQHRLEIYATALIRKLAQSISDKDKEFTGIPLQTRMLAEAFEEEFISFYLSEQSGPELPHKLNLVGLYRSFIDRKYEIYYREKSKTPAGNIATEEQQELYFKWMQEQHQLVALQSLFAEEQVTFLKNDHHYAFSDEQLTRIGIVQRNNEGKLHFIHRTFAEYVVAEFLIKQLTMENIRSPQKQDFLLNAVLLRTGCSVIRAFLNGLLEKCVPTEEALKQCGEQLNGQWNEKDVNGPLVRCKAALHDAATEDNANIIGLFLDSLVSGKHSEVLRKIVLAKDRQGRTAWHLAAENDSVEALKRIWEWAEVSVEMLVRAKQEQLKTKELKKKLLLVTDNYGYSAWQRAAVKGKVQVLETIWSFANEVELRPEELLLGKNKGQKTAWQVAVEEKNVKLLQKIWVCCKEAQLKPNELKNKLLLAKDNHGHTLWHVAAETSSIELLEAIWSWAKEAELNPKDMLLTRNGIGHTAWHMAAKKCHLEVLKKLWIWANEAQQKPKELKRTLLQTRDKDGYTAWHRAAEGGSLEALQTLWSWAEEVELNPHELLLTQSSQGFTAWQMAAQRNHLEVLRKLWVWANKVQWNPKALRNKLLLAKDRYGYTAWHRAAEEGNLGALEIVWSWAKEAEINTEEFLLAKNMKGKTAWKIAAKRCHFEILEKLWAWAKEEQLKPDMLENEMLLAKDKYGNTAFHLAAETGKLEALQLLWIWAKDVQLKPVELLLLENHYLYTAWQLAAYGVHLEVLKKLWEWAKEAHLNPNQLLLTKDGYGYTAWHRAAERSNVVALETLWNWAKEEEIKPDYLKKCWLLAQNKRGETAWNMATVGNNEEVLKKLWIWAKEMKLNRKDLKNKFLLAKDRYGYTVWHRAAERGRLQTLETLWSWAKEVGLNTEKFLLDQNKQGYTARQLATRRHLDVAEKLEVWEKEVQLNPQFRK